MLKSDPAADLESPARLRGMFAEFQPRTIKKPLRDFSRLHWGAPNFCELSPASAQEISEIVQLARERAVSLRTRGCGHALNGSSLPLPAEVVIDTRRLDTTRHHHDGTVSVGAGAVLWSVDSWLRDDGFALPVLNDGYAGPSVGGYASAGGFGPGSGVYGGFWENVSELTIVDGAGRIQRISREHPLFPWLFGSMGQLGIIIELRLDIVPRATLGREPHPEQRSRSLDQAPEDEAGRLFWFTLFVPESSLAPARAELDSLERRYPAAFAFRNRYTYLLRHRRIVAPLLWPHPTSCYAVGSWGILRDLGSRGMEGVREFDAGFTEMALACGYRRYLQSELPCGPALYERYFGQEVYSRFHAIKQAQDPANLLNPGWVFGKGE